MEIKKYFLGIAEIIDAFRTIPRIVLMVYGIMTWQVISWFMSIEVPTTEQSALVLAVVGAAALIIKFYQESGRKWDK